MLLQKTILLLIGLFLLIMTGSAQPPHCSFTALTTKDGLLSNTVNAILKDRSGLMWFATDDGLNKFDGTNFTVYRHHPGDSTSLRSNDILSLYEDKGGNLWVGSSGGAISRYDRQKDRFINYPGIGGNSAGKGNLSNAGGSDQPGPDSIAFLPNAVVRGMCSDYLGKIWIAQYAAPFVLDPMTGQIIKMSLLPPSPGSTPLAIFCVFEDSQHRMWVGTDGGGLFLYMRATHSFRQFRHNSLDPSSLLDDHVRALTEDKAGNLLIGTKEGLCRMLPDASGFATYHFSKEDSSRYGNGAADREINTIAVDKDGLLWIGTSNGVRIIHPPTGHVTSYAPDENDPHSLTSKNIVCMYIDHQGIYWIGTDRGGINKYDKNLNLFNWRLGDKFHEAGAGSSIITAFAERKDGNVWIGTDGGGLYVFDHANGRLQRMPVRINGTIADPLKVLSLRVTRTDELYIGTYGKGLILLDPATGQTRQLTWGAGMDDLSGNDIYCMKETRDGAIWVGTNGGGVDVLKDDKVVARYTPSPKAGAGSVDKLLPINGYIRAIEEDTAGNIWIGTHGGGIAVYDPNTHAFKIVDQNNSTLPSNMIESALLDSRGQIWIGTYGGGLSRWDKKSRQFTNFSEKDGLQNTTIYQIVEDAQGRIWVSTNTGISSWDAYTLTFRNYTSYNGLQHNNFAHGSGIRTSDGTMFFGGLQGFNYFSPTALTTNQYVPAVILTDLKVSNLSVVPGKNSPIREQISVANDIYLAYKQNFALSFVALNYTLPKENHYAYKLEGFDKDWNYTGTLNTAYYTNLDPGTYTFRVKASNNDGVWSAGDTTIRIYVRPPFWRTAYAYVFYVLAIAGLFFYSRYRSLSRLRKKFAQEQERQQTRRIQELDRLKLKFLTNLSHEFRTPVSLIMGPIDQLLSEQKDERSTTQLQMIKRNARRLLSLVNQLLDFRKMEEHELTLHLQEGDFVAFVKDVSQSFTDLSERKHIRFIIESNIDALYALFDHDKIERILFNLLSNAFKFTLEGGSITLVVKKADRSDSPAGKWVTIEVKDTGIGIPPEKKEKVFDRFFQHTSEGAVLAHGSGIGLSITKEFVKMHGGTIRVESEPGQGTTFTIDLPLTLAASPASTVPPAASTTSPASFGSPSSPVPDAAAVPESAPADRVLELPVILLVEDSEDFRFYLKDNLRDKYRVLEAPNGEDGWQKALSSHPQLIVTDINMPFMDGNTLTRKLKADKRTCHIPVILLTALNEDGAQLEGLETGANDYITKPFNVEVLNAKIKNLLALRDTLKTTYTKQIRVLTPETTIESEDERLLHKVVGYLEENLTNPQLSVELLSKQMGMSRSSLYNKLLEITGQKPVEYIRSYKLEKAAALLEKSDLTIAEIAYMTGFSTPNYFARAFKTRFNMLPSEYALRAKKQR